MCASRRLRGGLRGRRLAARLLVENSPTDRRLDNLFDEVLNWLLVATQVLRAFDRAEALEIGASGSLARRMGYVLTPWERERLDQARHDDRADLREREGTLRLCLRRASRSRAWRLPRARVKAELEQQPRSGFALGR